MTSKSGIYFLIKSNEIIYIGKTTNYPHRPFCSHMISKYEYDKVKFLEYKEKDLRRFEIAYIKKYRPIFNHDHNPDRRKKKKRKLVATSIKRRMRFRKLSHKSFIGFGYNKDRKVEEMIRIGKELDLCSMYFKCSHISFLPEVLNDLKITDEWQIKETWH